MILFQKKVKFQPVSITAQSIYHLIINFRILTKNCTKNLRKGFGVWGLGFGVWGLGARVAAASDKCFYFQADHWRGTVSESVPQSETYAWDGHYFFNKATGAGGAYVENFRVAGQSGDPTTVPGFPEEYKQYFSQGRGGVQALGDVQADPRCATKPNPNGPGGGSVGPAVRRHRSRSRVVCRAGGSRAASAA